jgi:hypothetical protein
MLDYIISHPLYIPFTIFNSYIIYKIIKTVLVKDKDKNDDDEDGGIFANDFPKLDLPPGVTLSNSPKETVIND